MFFIIKMTYINNNYKFGEEHMWSISSLRLEVTSIYSTYT